MGRPEDGIDIVTQSPSLTSHNAQPPIKVLLVDYPARSPVEKATAATVAIQTPVGFGSGFFITPQGHIVTNKHVIRLSESQSAQIQSNINETQDRLTAMNRILDDESHQLDAYKRGLDDMKTRIGSESNLQRKNSLHAEYEAGLKRYMDWHQDFQLRRQTLSTQMKSFDDQRQSFEYDQTLAGLTRHFTITLVDGSQYPVYLLAVSQTHDLALLKLDGYQTPTLPRGDLRGLVQGDPVFAVGSPSGLQNSVTSGIFSGLQSGFLQTNAQIYPGNSGGPLINKNENVLGVNSFKKLTHKFEGLGFAIPISTVWDEFNTFLALP